MVGYFFKFFYFNLLKFWWLPTLIQRPATEKRSSKKINIGQLALYLFALPFFHLFTGKSLSDALILASTNPQYDKILFIDLPVQYMKTTSSEHVVYINCFLFWHSEQFLNTTCSELVVTLWVTWCKNKFFSKILTCTLLLFS